MALRRAGLGFVAAVLLLLAGGDAAAEQRWFVDGTIDLVDEEARSIHLNGQILYIGVASEIQRADSLPGDWEDVVDRDGEHASALVRRGYRGTEVLRILLADSVEDAE